MALSATTKVNLRRAFCTAVTATGVIAPGAVWYNNEYSALSNDRAPVIGEAQYKALSAEADAVLAKDRELFTLTKAITNMGQEQIASPNDATLAQKIETTTAARTALQEVVKQDFLNVTRKLLISQGIAETDAVEISDKFQSSYALKDQYDVYKSTFKLRNLDECQTKYLNDAKAANQDGPVYVESCLTNTTHVGEIAGFGGMFGLLGGVMGAMLTFMTMIGMNSRHEELLRQSKREKDDKKRAAADPKPKENKEHKLEITVRRK